MKAAIIPALAGRIHALFQIPAKRPKRAGRVLLNTVHCVNFVTFVAVGALVLATPAAARDSLGVFETWGAFRDPGVPRCYAIARSERRGGPIGYATVGIWPRAKVRGQVHFRLSRAVGPGTRIDLRISGQSIALVGSGTDAWAPDARGDAAVIAAMRSAERMTLRARVHRFQGGSFADSYLLAGAATAMDAALVGCAGD
jgi:hypothetical protein